MWWGVECRIRVGDRVSARGRWWLLQEYLGDLCPLTAEWKLDLSIARDCGKGMGCRRMEHAPASCPKSERRRENVREEREFVRL